MMTINNTDALTPQEQFMRTAPDLYEKFILLELDANKDFWFLMQKNNLCFTAKKLWVNDFANVEYYILYRAIYYWRNLTTGTKFEPISEGGLKAAMDYLAAEVPPIVSPESTTLYIQDFLKWKKNYTPAEVHAIVKDTYRLWLCNKKWQGVLNDNRRKGLMANLDKTVSTLSNIRHTVYSEEEGVNKRRWDISALKNNQEEIIERMPLTTTFRRVNECLGGGLGKGEHVIFLAPTGGGKTVFACQLATEMALAGRGVILVTTEQHPQELYPRLISNASTIVNGGKYGIRFEIIKDGITQEALKRLSEGQRNTMNQIANSLDGRLVLANWTGGQTVNDLPSFIEEVQKEMASRNVSLDCLILDWIGGALTEKTKDPTKLRLILNETSQLMKTFAVQFHMAVVSMTQTSKDGIDKNKVSEQYFAESKTLHFTADAGIGISAKRAPKDSDDGEDVYEKMQSMYCFKSRKGKGKYWKIERNFDFQRFERM